MSMIKNLLDKLRGIVYVKRQLKRQPSLTSDQKKDIFDTYMRTYVRDCSDEKRLDLMGYKLNICNYEGYKFLLNELFINQEYAFNGVGDAPFIIDCGSNIGMSIIFFKDRYANAEIVAFEPDDEAFACLEKNVQENNFDKVTVNKKAVSKDGGEISFFVEGSGDGSLTSSLAETTNSRRVTIDSVKLSDFIDREVDILKMDIEGAETEVIQELSDAGKLRNIKQMSIEYHHHCYSAGDEMSKILQTLEQNDFGYQLEAHLRRPFERDEEQGMIIYAYRKDAHPT
ncbi:MAG: FkbM family methyltransferase [Pseudomonadota bacterium]